jgi:hypothetical protein
MPRLLLLLLCLLFASRMSSAQSASTQGANAVPDGCPVTTQYQATPFVPPKPYSHEAGIGSFWFGTDKLWTVLPIDGAWRGRDIMLRMIRPSGRSSSFGGKATTGIQNHARI